MDRVRERARLPLEVQEDNVLATPHIGYVAENLYRTFYGDAAVSIAAWLDEIADSNRA